MTLRQIGQLVLMSALWGAVFMLIKYALEDFSAVEVAFFQAAIGAVGLLAIVLVEGGRARATMTDFLRRPLPAILLGAAASGAVSSFVVKLQYRDKGVPPSTTTLFSLGVGAVLVAPVAVITASRDVPGARAIIAVIVLGLACTAVTFMLYYQLIAEVGEERAALGNYLTPIFALFYGVILLGEPLTIAAVAGLALIIVGAEITLRGDSARRAGGKAKAHEYRTHPPFH
jgi:drug/metabolite transporter (DMT)-like permease